MNNVRRLVLVMALLFLTLVFLWTIFGSLEVTTKTGEQCGPETVVPCIIYDIEEQKDILTEYRPVFSGLVGALIVLILIASIKQSQRKK